MPSYQYVAGTAEKVVFMKNKKIYTNLAVDECKNLFKLAIKQSADRLFKFRKPKFIGDFHCNTFWISTSTLSLFLENSCRILNGTIIENNNGKNTINCQFDALKSFMIPFSKRILFLLPFISLPTLLMGKTTDFLLRLGSFICVLFLMNMIIYCLTFYQFHTMLKFVKKLFICEIGE